jgi:hypothetical protein
MLSNNYAVKYDGGTKERPDEWNWKFPLCGIENIKNIYHIKNYYYKNLKWIITGKSN